MVTINKRFTDVTWYASGLTLSALSTTVKAAIDRVEKLNAAGTGKLSWSPTADINSFSAVATGDQLVVVAKTPVTAFTIDNGTLPTGNATVPSPRDFGLSGQAGVTETDSVIVVTDNKFTASDIVFSQGTGTVTFRINDGEYLPMAAFNTAMQNTAILTHFYWKVQHAGAFTMKFTATYY